MKTIALIGMGVFIIVAIYDIARTVKNAFSVFQDGAMPDLEDIEP
jgi:hypothetical protein